MAQDKIGERSTTKRALSLKLSLAICKIIQAISIKAKLLVLTEVKIVIMNSQNVYLCVCFK